MSGEYQRGLEDAARAVAVLHLKRARALTEEQRPGDAVMEWLREAHAQIEALAEAVPSPSTTPSPAPAGLKDGEVERLAGVAVRAAESVPVDWTANSEVNDQRRWVAVVTALLADPAVGGAIWRAGAGAMREAAAVKAGDMSPENTCGVPLCGYDADAQTVADSIRALPLPPYPGGEGERES